MSNKLMLSITGLASKLSVGIRPKSVLFHPIEVNDKFADFSDSEFIPVEVGTTFTLLNEEFRIGRSAETSDLVIRGDRELSLQISRTHLRIVAIPGKSYELRNETGTSKSYLNGRALEPGEAVAIGYNEKLDIAGGLCVIECLDSEATQVTTTLSREGLVLSLTGDRRLWPIDNDENKAKLSPSEYKLLYCLMEHAQEHLAYEEILQIGFDEPVETADAPEIEYAIKNLQTLKSRLQNKLESVDPETLYIESIPKWGARSAGYKFYRH